MSTSSGFLAVCPALKLKPKVDARELVVSGLGMGVNLSQLFHLLSVLKSSALEGKIQPLLSFSR